MAIGRARCSSRCSLTSASCAASSTGNLASGWEYGCFDLRDPNAARDKALIRLQQLPSRETLHAWDDELSLALDGKADEKILSLLLATMLDGFPRGMVPNIRTYVEGTLLVIADQALSPEILAAAILRIWRKDRFSANDRRITGRVRSCSSGRCQCAAGGRPN